MAREKEKKTRRTLIPREGNAPAVYGRAKLREPVAPPAIQRPVKEITQAASLLNRAPVKPAEIDKNLAGIFQEAVKGGMDPTEAIRALSASRADVDTGVRPRGGYGEQNLSSLYEGLFGKPEGTGRLTTDKGGGVIEKVKGRPSGDFGYGEGNVYVPGRDVGYQIRTPSDYKKGRSDFIKEVQTEGQIPGDFQQFRPIEPVKSLLSPGTSQTITQKGRGAPSPLGGPEKTPFQTAGLDLAAGGGGFGAEFTGGVPGPRGKSIPSGLPGTLRDPNTMVGSLLNAVLGTPSALAATDPPDRPQEAPGAPKIADPAAGGGGFGADLGPVAPGFDTSTQESGKIIGESTKSRSQKGILARLKSLYEQDRQRAGSFVNQSSSLLTTRPR